MKSFRQQPVEKNGCLPVWHRHLGQGNTRWKPVPHFFNGLPGGNASSNWTDFNFGMLGWQPIGAARASAIARRPLTRSCNELARLTLRITGRKPVQHDPLRGFSDFFVEAKELFEGPQNHPEVGTGLRAGGSGVVMDADLADGVTALLGPRQDLRINQRPGRFHLDFLEQAARKNLERTVDVAQPESKDGVDQRGPGQGVEFAHERIFSIQSVGTDDVVFLDERKQQVDFFEVELTVAVGVENPGPGRLAETAL